ncbi:RNA-directed DNA polymerase, eukaryota, reverse transcriptase zinc-binding domain protein [Tanacetum coccineum]
MVRVRIFFIISSSLFVVTPLGHILCSTALRFLRVMFHVCGRVSWLVSIHVILSPRLTVFGAGRLVGACLNSNRGSRDNGSESGRDENERGNGMGTRTKDKDGNEGIEIDLNSVQFPPISEMGKNSKENDQRKDCLGDRDNCKNNIGNTEESDETTKEGYESSNNEVGTNGKMNMDEIAEFQDEEGVKEVINNGPWMVKLRNVPMEAWSVKGISAIASSIGKPVIMDEVTTKMCVTGVGRLGFARVLVEIDAEKGINDKVEIMYRSKNITDGTKKTVDVEYAWIPCICSQCKVFGHTDSFCKKEQGNGSDNGSVKASDNDFMVKQNRKSKHNNEGTRKTKENGKEHQQGSNSKERSERNGISGTNRFDVLRSLCNEDELNINFEQRKIVDDMISKENDKENKGMEEWSEGMKQYFRGRKEMFNAAKENQENEDVVEIECVEGNDILRNEVEGGGGSILN